MYPLCTPILRLLHKCAGLPIEQVMEQVEARLQGGGDKTPRIRSRAFRASRIRRQFRDLWTPDKVYSHGHLAMWGCCTLDTLFVDGQGILRLHEEAPAPGEGHRSLRRKARANIRPLKTPVGGWLSHEEVVQWVGERKVEEFQGRCFWIFYKGMFSPRESREAFSKQDKKMLKRVPSRLRGDLLIFRFAA